ncbi:fibrinogen alpha chain-like [Acipenser ruthenus]|uniref:fibrinogen alpha chain-like n=1 Tax=Acipenser ruthenus TaxID=7906 RepID=UPI0027418EBD|nr:fibrinogen alpha chain-like [Acipenser ruthenus]XP_033890060.3 fibrinogen alpha chain-like [Acipenser ruthenus]XP_058887565.1 fibrinogen alpha chain-like [Acipenser ruthenus]XP_058887570.1 fibrinogen alpha chain-like [Acipenser ruthenus]XP_058887571.1 fibrinogen alpha chain-like [Acipenser ruthenus]XP_058887577.1 fibrinogen alpha chain-like [Acipenser ruthenus]
MRRLHLLCCLLAVFSTAWSQKVAFGDIAQGRGPRPVEQGYKSQCATEKEWAACTDDDWGLKCPSGCRIQGLLSQADRDIAERIDRIRKFLEENRNRYKSTDQFTKQTYDYIREQLISDSGNDNKYVNLADQLRRRIVDLKLKIDNQLRILIALKDKIREQVDTMQALEVDIDIKIRACKGSCASAFVYNVNTESYVTLEKQISQIENINLQRVGNDNSMRIVTMRPLRGDIDTVSSVYKSTLVTEGGEKSIFRDVEQLRLSLETANYGIKHSSAEVSATPAVGSGSVSIGSSSGDRLSAKETSISGKSTSGSTVTTHTKVVTCTKTVKKRIVYTKDGPVETVEMTGGSPECDHLESLGTDDAVHSSVKEGKGDSGSFTMKVSGTSGGVDGISDRFPDLHSFFNKHSSSSKSTTEVRDSGGSSVGITSTTELPDNSRVKTVVYSDMGRGDGGFESQFGGGDFSAFNTETVFPGGSKMSDRKGSSSYSKTTVVSSGSSEEGPFSEHRMPTSILGSIGDDFVHNEDDDDVPDFHARSLKKEAVELVKGYVGKDCDDIRQKHASGHTSGLYQIKPEGSEVAVTVYCDQDTVLGGWVLVQQRMDGSVNFNRTWEEYKMGFGSTNEQGQGELWLGNKYIHLLTQKESILRVELEDWEGHSTDAEYLVDVGPESEGYRLKVSKYSGDAGDALIKGEPGLGPFLSHVDMKFSTYDKDNDKFEDNCAEMYGGGWWYNNCQAANLNGVYYTGGQYDPHSKAPYEIENGVVWGTFKPQDYSLKIVKMKIRPIETH